LSQAQTPGVLTILFETNKPAGGKYGSLNVQAVWVERADGSFVNTLDSWGAKHAKQLKTWTAADKQWNIHARTCATLMAYGPCISRWDAPTPRQISRRRYMSVSNCHDAPKQIHRGLRSINSFSQYVGASDGATKRFCRGGGKNENPVRTRPHPLIRTK
jgi:hypothetical protein